MAELTFDLKFKTENLKITISEDATILQLKSLIKERINVEEINMKLIISGKSNFDNEKTIKSYNFKKPVKGMIIGEENSKIKNFQSVANKLEEEKKEIDRIREMKELQRLREQERLRIEMEEERLRKEEERRQQEEERRNMRLMNEIREEMNDEANMTFSLKCFSIALLEKEGVKNVGSKIILHESMLQKFIDNKVNFPIMLKLHKENSDVNIVASVLDFSGHEDSAYLPFWMMQSLNLDEGDTVQFESVKLEKADYVKLVPHQHNFQDLSTSNSLAIIELALTLQYPLLTRSTTIVIEGQGKLWEFDVEKLEKGGDTLDFASVMDTDLKIDFAPALNDESMEQPTQELLLGTTNQLTATVQQSEHHNFVLDLKKMEEFTEFQQNMCDIKIQVDCKDNNADLDLYLSSTESSPTIDDCEVFDNRQGRCELTFSYSQLSRPSRVFVAVQCYKGGPAKFTISAIKVDNINNKDKGQVLNQNNIISDVPNEFCMNCKKFVPKPSFGLHEISCKRNFFYCDKCDVSVPIHSKDKHAELYHTFTTCSQCGLKNLERYLVKKHKEKYCDMKLTKCYYCSLKIVEREKFEHMDYCGSRSCVCAHCNNNFKRKDMRHHLMTVHQILPSDISFDNDILNI